jgi:putative transposase
VFPWAHFSSVFPFAYCRRESSIADGALRIKSGTEDSSAVELPQAGCILGVAPGLRILVGARGAARKRAMDVKDARVAALSDSERRRELVVVVCRRKADMKRARFNEEQIISILKEAEAGAKVTELCRRHGISVATFYPWHNSYGGLEISEVRRVRQLEEENRRLKSIVADQALDIRALKDVLAKNGYGP